MRNLILIIALCLSGILQAQNDNHRRAALLAGGGGVSVVGAPGAEARFNFDSNLTDSAGSNSLTRTDGSGNAYNTSLNGQAFIFSGDDAFEFTDADLETLSWSVSIIFKANTTTFAILSELSRQSSENHGGINLWGDETPYIKVDDANYQTSTNLVDNSTWYHLIGTYDHTTGTYALYLDGNPIPLTSGTDPTNNLTGNGKVYIGGRPDNSSEFFIGEIDMVAWWSRSLDATDRGTEFGAFNRTN